MRLILKRINTQNSKIISNKALEEMVGQTLFLDSFQEGGYDQSIEDDIELNEIFVIKNLPNVDRLLLAILDSIL